MPILGVVQKMLDRNEVIPGNDRLMVVSIEALGPVASILSGFMGQIAGRIGFPGQHISAMPFISKHLHNGIRCPLDISQVGLPTHLGKCCGNVRRGISVQIHIKDELHRRRFLRIDHQVSIRIMGISQQLRSKRHPAVQTHS